VGAGSSADQGLFFYIFHVRLRGYMVATQPNYTVRHFQSPGKPWELNVGSGALMRNWPYYEDLPIDGLQINGTPCARKLRARLHSIQRSRRAAMSASPAIARNARGSPSRTQLKPETHKDGGRSHDPVTGLRYRRHRRQLVF
jgi:hypothetical protein